jgi:GrpB-like predicted nucleotidyltransferase (UPF0157 family)
VSASAWKVADALQLARIIRRLKQQVGADELGGESVEQFVRRYARVRLPDLDLNAQTDYDPHWPRIFESEKQRLQTAFAAGTTIRIEHIGSTSIPHARSKNILDIAVAMQGPSSPEHQARALAELGYQAYGESPIDAAFSWHWRIGRGGDSTFVVHTCPADSPRFADITNFRDFLRAFPGEQRRYVELKRELSAVTGQTWLEYSALKKALVVRITARANAWRIAQDMPQDTMQTLASDPPTQSDRA